MGNAAHATALHDNRDSIIALDEIRRYPEGGGVTLTLAHEVAHGLGLDHDVAGACGNAATGNLMTGQRQLNPFDRSRFAVGVQYDF